MLTVLVSTVAASPSRAMRITSSWPGVASVPHPVNVVVAEISTSPLAPAPSAAKSILTGVPMPVVAEVDEAMLTICATYLRVPVSAPINSAIFIVGSTVVSQSCGTRMRNSIQLTNWSAELVNVTQPVAHGCAGRANRAIGSIHAERRSELRKAPELQDIPWRGIEGLVGRRLRA